MTFMRATKICLQKYLVRSGRASRSEYWWFICAILAAAFVAGIIDALAFGPSLSLGVFGVAVFLASVVPSFTASVRRLHDTGRSGWYLLVPVGGAVLGIGFGAVMGPYLGQVASIITGLIILTGFLLPYWWQIRPSQIGPNQYGPNLAGVTQ